MIASLSESNFHRPSVQIMIVGKLQMLESESFLFQCTRILNVVSVERKGVHSLQEALLGGITCRMTSRI